MKKVYASMLLLGLAYHTGMAQEQPHDTLMTNRTYKINEVVVTGARNETVCER